MPCDARMRVNLIQGLLLLCLLGCGFIVESLEPGFLDFDNLPDTNFSCVGKVIGGYYADLETNCQMFHVCTIGQLDEPMDIRFLCLNGTVFDQETRVCERIDEVDCSKSEQFYSLNLELYGNTQSPNLEESPEVEISSESRKSSSTTTTTTTTTKKPRPKTNSTPHYYTTSAPSTTTRIPPKVITSHQFPVGTSSDIRFNPEEINISLNPGSLPSIRPSIHSYQPYHDDNGRITVTTHKNDKPHRVPLLPSIFGEIEKISTTQQPKSIVSYDLTHNKPVSTPGDINYDYSYQTEKNIEYHTDLPRNYNYNQNIVNLRPPPPNPHPYNPIRNNHFIQNYQVTSKRPFKLSFPAATTYRSHSIFSVKPQVIRTEKPPRLQLPLPLLPTLPPLTFSSPAPFALGRHIETKRFTNEHQPPRIVISASASVSDNSGRRLNYSLGTIGTTQLIELPKTAFDEDMEVDAFYQDVPKIKRHKRNIENDTIIRNEEDTTDVLKLLFNWYSKQEESTKISIPISSDDITQINQELGSTLRSDYDYENLPPQNLTNLTEAASESGKNETETTELPEYYDYYYDDETNATIKPDLENVKNLTEELPPPEYVDDNYEPSIYENSSIPTNSSSEQPQKEIQPRNDIDVKELLPIQSLDEKENPQVPQTTSGIEENLTKTPIVAPIATTTPDWTFNTNIYAFNTESYKQMDVLPSTVDVPKHMDVTEEESSLSSTTIGGFGTTVEQIQETIKAVEGATKSVVEMKYQTTTESLELMFRDDAGNSTENSTITDSVTELVTDSEELTELLEKEIEKVTIPVVSLSSSEEPTTNRYQYVRTREPWRRRQETTNRNYSRHRFSSYDRKTSARKRPEIETSIINILNITEKLSSLNDTANLSDSELVSTTAIPSSSEISQLPVTDATLSKSANPTRAKNVMLSKSTTPLSRLVRVEYRREKAGRTYTFNCFNKKINSFYSDPRDCRLFHYCTSGYSKNQLVDMKFVCDLGTYFDDEKLICTKTKPTRCL